MTARPRAVCIERIGLTVADLSASCGFFEHGLGFQTVGFERRDGEAFARLTGLMGAAAEVGVLRLGRQEIELVAFTEPGDPYPPEPCAADPWFQHFAIVVADMPGAYGILRGRPGWLEISDGGPQRLPPESGSVTAFKFRDPEGHPLELSCFPPAAAAPEWRDPPPGAVFLGVDHSAIAVRDADAASAFYEQWLGLRPGARQVNSGPTQDRLDGLPCARVDIVSLTFAGGGPHLELLRYLEPPPTAAPIAPRVNDIAATRLVLEVERLGDLLSALPAAASVSHGLAIMDDGSRRALVRDPDGHLLELHERSEAGSARLAPPRPS